MNLRTSFHSLYFISLLINAVIHVTLSITSLMISLACTSLTISFACTSQTISLACTS